MTTAAATFAPDISLGGPQPRVAVVIPVLNAAECLPRCIASVRHLATGGVFVVDGGSNDNTASLAEQAGATVVTSPRGRGRQLRAGAEATAPEPWLLFLHADTVLAPDAADAVYRHTTDPGMEGRAGFFRFRFDHDHPAARRVERWVALRCRLFALPFGDQGLLISRTLYEQVGGFRPIPLMEDVDLVERVGRRRLTCLPADAVTSATRYRQEGYVRRGTKNLMCCALYRLGVAPERIARFYGYRTTP